MANITVKAAPSQGERVALWDVDARHPDGEIFVAGQDSPAVKASDTPRVREALKAGRLIEAKGGEADASSRERQTVAELRERADTTEDAAEVEHLLAEERASESPRKSAVELLEARLEALRQG